MEVVRADILASFTLDYVQTPHTLSRRVRQIGTQIGGCIVPGPLLPDASPEAQLQTVASWLPKVGNYEIKGDIAHYSTPPGDEPLHTDRPELLPEGTTLRLHQIDSTYKRRTLVTVSTVYKEGVPPGVLVEPNDSFETGQGIGLFVYRAVVWGGAVTMFDPRNPHSFTSVDNRTELRPFWVANVGSR